MDANSTGTPHTRPDWPLVAILGIESVLICFGNSLTVFIFWKRRRRLKRTAYFLINLTAADLGVGVCAAVQTALMSISRDERARNWAAAPLNLCTLASLFTLTAVALETAYAVVFPLCHRTTSISVYRFAVVLIWLLAVVSQVSISLGPIFSPNPVKTMSVPMVITTALSAVCIILITLSYALVWCVMIRRPKRLQTRDRVEKKKLATTLFIVTVLSLTTWIPGQSNMIAKMFTPNSDETTHIVFLLLLANSFVNPLVYACRQPEFRGDVKRTLCRCAGPEEAGPAAVGVASRLPALPRKEIVM